MGTRRVEPSASFFPHSFLAKRMGPRVRGWVSPVSRGLKAAHASKRKGAGFGGGAPQKVRTPASTGLEVANTSNHQRADTPWAGGSFPKIRPMAWAPSGVNW